MKIKIFTCPECRYRKFESLSALNIHMGKAHTVSYKIIMKNNQPYVMQKKRSSFQYLNQPKKKRNDL